MRLARLSRRLHLPAGWTPTVALSAVVLLIVLT